MLTRWVGHWGQWVVSGASDIPRVGGGGDRTGVLESSLSTLLPIYTTYCEVHHGVCPPGL